MFMSIFVSYHSKDIEHVGFLDSENINNDKKLNLWIAYQKKEGKKNVPSGEKFEQEIINAIRNSSGAIIFLSSEFLKRKFIIENELPEIFKRKKLLGTSYTVSIVLVDEVDDYSNFPELANRQLVNSPGTSLQELKNRSANSYRLVFRDVLDDFLRPKFNFLDRIKKINNRLSTLILFISIIFLGIIFNIGDNFSETTDNLISEQSQKVDTTIFLEEKLDSLIEIKGVPLDSCINFINDELNQGILITDPFNFKVQQIDCQLPHDAQFLGSFNWENSQQGKINTNQPLFGFYYKNDEDAPIISEIIPGLPAYDSDLQVGDQILRINNSYVPYKWLLSSRTTRIKNLEETLFQVKRADETLEFTITPTNRLIDNNPDEITASAFDQCSNLLDDFMNTENFLNDYRDKFDNESVGWLPAVFIDFESQKYYSQFNIYCFLINVDQNTFSFDSILENGKVERDLNSRIIESINDSNIIKKDFSIYDVNNGLFKFNKISNPVFSYNSFDTLEPGNCFRKYSNSIENNNIIKTNFVNSNINIAIGNCEELYFSQVFNTFEIDSKIYLETPGSEKFISKLKGECKNSLSELNYLPDIAKYTSIGGFIKLSDEIQEFRESFVEDVYYLYLDDLRIKVICTIIFIEPAETDEIGQDWDPIFQKPNIFSTRKTENEYNNLSIDYCPSIAPFGYYYLDSNNELVSLPSFYETIKIPITWNQTEDFKVEEISWFTEGVYEARSESTSLIRYNQDENSPYLNVGTSLSYVVEIETAGRDYDNYFNFNEDFLRIVILVSTSKGDNYALTCNTKVINQPSKEELMFYGTTNEGLKEVFKYDLDEDFLRYVDTSVLKHPYLPELVQIYLDYSEETGFTEFGFGFQSRYEISEWSAWFTLCEFPEVTPCRDKSYLSYNTLGSIGGSAFPSQGFSKSVFFDTSGDTPIAFGLYFALVGSPTELVSHSLSDSCKVDQSRFFEDQNFYFECFENTNPEQIYAALNTLSVTFSGEDELFGEFTCDVKYQFMPNKIFNGNQSTYKIPTLPAIYWGTKSNLTDGVNEIEKNCDLLKRTGLPSYTDRNDLTYYYFPNYSIKSIWDYGYLGDIPVKKIYDKNS